MRVGVWYTAVAVLMAGLVGVVGSGTTGDGSGVWAGALIGLVVQVVGFWLLFVWLLPRKRGLAHGLGMLLRFAAVAAVALLWLPDAGLAAAPTLFSLVGVLFLTTVAEPVVLQIDSSRAARPTAVGG